MATPTGPPVPPELEGLSPEALRFWRLIEERWMEDDAEVIELACGHKFANVGSPIPKTQLYLPCSQCVTAYVDAERKTRRP